MILKEMKTVEYGLKQTTAARATQRRLPIDEARTVRVSDHISGNILDLFWPQKDFINAGANKEVVKVDICGTEDGKQVAWVTVDRNGRVTFLNRQGETSSCILENGLQIPSYCSSESSTSSQAFESTLTRSQSSVLDPNEDTASPALFTGKPSTKTLTLISTNYRTLVATSTRESIRETLLADHSLSSMSKPAYTCSCPVIV